MLISTKGRYALRVLCELACHEDKPESLLDISKKENISFKYLEQIMRILVKEKLVKSVRGAQGGYLLNEKADKIIVGDVLRLVEGTLAPIHCLVDKVNMCDHASKCTTLEFWEGLDNVVTNYVNSYTIQDLAFHKKIKEIEK